MELQNRDVRVFDSQAIADLQSGMNGKVILPHHAEYESARMIWNGIFDRRPALVVRCSDARDVAQAIRFARSQNLEVSVRGGGHSIPGYSTMDGALVIDLSPMKDVLVDAQKQTAMVSAGLTLAEFMRAAQAYGLATTTGTASDTGVAGLTLGGGIGWLMGKYGLACDNVLSFEVVTAAGEILRASDTENPDLFWGLRGGGGNFGVVTTFEFQLHPVATVLSGMVLHPMTKAREVLEFYREFADQAPDELIVYSALVTSPDGHPVIGMLPCYCGNLEEGQRILEPLRKFGSPLVDMIRPMAYLDLLYMLDEESPRGRKYYDKGLGIPALSDQAIDVLIEARMSMTSPFSMIMIQHVHGQAARIAPDATAFSARGESYMPLLLAGWDEGPAEPHKEWARKHWNALKPLANDENYVNFMSVEEQGLVPTAYGSNYARLLELKRRYDPDNVFHLNANIRPD